jgi:Sec-independent protein translocase protein TatA
MPTAPTFSKRFYDKFGPENVTELARWLNQMDLTYRTQLHELNELNFARFDAKLEQRIAEVKAELREEMADLKAGLREEMAALKAELLQAIAEMGAALRQEMAQANADLRREISESNARLIRWMFVFWTGTVITLLGAMFAITQL